MRLCRRVRDAVGVATATAVLFAAAEGVIRLAYHLRNTAVEVVVLPYTAAQDWGPVPPWIDGLRILERDPVLLWRNRPGVRRAYLDVYGPARVEEDRVALLGRFFPSVPESLRERPTWRVSINTLGFRDREFEAAKPPSTFRIACLGDSWTFGANVDAERAYPQRLAELLARRFPHAGVEVLNLGVMGYSSRQGLELLRRRVLDLAPDLVLVGFAMNDSLAAGWRDTDSVGRADRRLGRVARWVDGFETLALARYLVERFRHEPWTLGDYLRRVSGAAGTQDEIWTGRQAVEFAGEDALEAHARVPPRAYEENLLEMIRLARSRRAGAILLYNELWDSPYRAAVARVARAAGVPWVDGKALVDAARQRSERDLGERLGLHPAGPAGGPAAGAAGAVEVVLRVSAGRHPVPTTLFVAGSHTSLGAGVPNRVAMYDDATHGDERAGDGVFSLAVALEPGARVFYVYTNSGPEGRWEGLDVPDLRHFALPAREAPVRRYRPIETFGALALQADGWHTNADGYERIAAAVLDVLARSETLRGLVCKSPAQVLDAASDC